MPSSRGRVRLLGTTSCSKGFDASFCAPLAPSPLPSTPTHLPSGPLNLSVACAALHWLPCRVRRLERATERRQENGCHQKAECSLPFVRQTCCRENLVFANHVRDSEGLIQARMGVLRSCPLLPHAFITGANESISETHKISRYDKAVKLGDKGQPLRLDDNVSGS